MCVPGNLHIPGPESNLHPEGPEILKVIYSNEDRQFLAVQLHVLLKGSHGEAASVNVEYPVNSVKARRRLFTISLSFALFSAINLTIVIDKITILGRELTRFRALI